MEHDSLISKLSERLGAQGLLLEQADRAPYERSARHAGGQAKGVVRPATLDDLAWSVGELVNAGCAIVAQGAATGLVGAATPRSDASQWVLSTQRLRDRLEIDPVNRSALVSAGHRLSDVNRAAAEHGLFFPIDLGADPSIGGMIATNTGGSRLIRYGGVRHNLLGTQAVLVHPPGTVVESMRGLRKDNTGLDWSQLMAGTFGAFGIVSQAVLRLHPMPRQSATALVSVESAAVAMDLLCSLEDRLGDFVTAFEGISGPALAAAVSHLPGTPLPFSQPPRYCVLMELSSSVSRDAGLDLDALLFAWLETQIEHGVIDAVVDKPERLWRIRHAISEAVQSQGRLVAFDVAVSRSKFASFRACAIDTVLAHVPGAHVCDFGHLGDGGVHLNLVIPAETSAETLRQLRTAVYDLVVREFAGSYSAEHGIGPYNIDYYQRYSDAPTRALAAALHHHFDPRQQLGNVRLDGEHS